jgi:DNA invertase Pin-like site-specific DNA recombinase
MNSSADESGDLLAPVPCSGALVGYGRVSSREQDLARQRARLSEKRKGVGFHSLHERLDTPTAGGRFVFHVFAALAEFIRTIIAANTNKGLDAAPARGQRLGRPQRSPPRRSLTR